MVFGQLAELTGSDNVMVEEAINTDELVQQLQQKYPSLIGAAYSIAVDKKLINDNTILNSSSTVALLPPFSGG